MSRAIVLGAAAVAIGAAAGGWTIGHGQVHAAAPGRTVPAATATVTRGTITVSEQDPGTIGYAGGFTVYSVAAGTVTWLPAAGAVIRPGGRLFAVDGQDVVLMRGATPAWRAFFPGMSDGADVAELQRNLVALGYDPYHAITPGDHYDWATQAAIERWQLAEGWLPDGQIALGEVAFLPGPVRVAALASGAGATVAAGAPVLTGTSVTEVVTVALPSPERSAVTAGQRVTITLPDGAATTGRVRGLAPAAASAPPPAVREAVRGPVRAAGPHPGPGPALRRRSASWSAWTTRRPRPAWTERRSRSRSPPRSSAMPWSPRSAPCWPGRAAASRSPS